MKLRKKLSVVLASAMVLTAVPVVTMAETETTKESTVETSTKVTLKKGVVKVQKNQEFSVVGTANAISLRFDHDAEDHEKEIAYITLENAEWNTKAFNEANKFTEQDDNIWTMEEKGVKVTFQKQDAIMKVIIEEFKANEPVHLPLLVKATGGDAKVTIKNEGNGTIKDTSFVFATTADKKASVELKDATSFYREGEIAGLVIKETIPGSLADGATFTIELDDTNFYFKEGQTVNVKGTYGFAGEDLEGKVTATPSKEDSSTLEIKISGIKGDGSTIGTLELSGIQVKSFDKTPEEGELIADIKGDDIAAALTDKVVAKVTKYATYLKMADEKAVEVKAGRIQEIKFSLGESVEDSIISEREVEVSIENAHFDLKGLVNDLFEVEVEVEDEDEDKAGKATELRKGAAAVKAAYGDESEESYRKAATKLDPSELAKKIIENTGDDAWATTGSKATTVEFDVDEKGLAIADKIIVHIGNFDGKPAQSNDKSDEMKFVTKVCVPVTNREAGKATIKATGRALENEVSVDAITIINPFDITHEQATIKVGLQNQVSGSLTLTEKDKDMFQKGDITFSIKDAGETTGIYLSDVTVETSAGIKGYKTTKQTGTAKSATVTLNRSTKDAGSISFKDMTFTTDRTVPEGTYDLEIGGTGIDADGHTIVIEDFIKITTSNTQDITASGLATGTSTFVIGESKYLFEGKEYTMDAPSYIQDPGYTMVPVRYVAEAFGVAKTDIIFGNGTVTIFAGERTISLTNGSNVAIVNGNKVPMGTAVVIKDGRTYAPASQIAGLLGISSKWDETTKTATFTNN